MPRNRALVRVLQLWRSTSAREYVSLVNLAIEFNVSTRTIRRDFEALQAAGIRVPRYADFREEYAQARRVALEDAHLARIEKNRTDDLTRIAKEDADAKAVNRELLAEIVRLRALLERREQLPAVDAVREESP